MGFKGEYHHKVGSSAKLLSNATCCALERSSCQDCAPECMISGTTTWRVAQVLLHRSSMQSQHWHIYMFGEPPQVAIQSSLWISSCKLVKPWDAHQAAGLLVGLQVQEPQRPTLHR